MSIAAQNFLRAWLLLVVMSCAPEHIELAAVSAAQEAAISSYATEDQQARATALAARASVDDLIRMQAFLRGSKVGRSIQSIRDSIERADAAIARGSPDEAFWISPSAGGKLSALATGIGLATGHPGIAWAVSGLASKASSTVNSNERAVRALLRGVSAPTFESLRHAICLAVAMETDRHISAARAFDSTLGLKLGVLSSDTRRMVEDKLPELKILSVLDNQSAQLTTLGGQLAAATDQLGSINRFVGEMAAAEKAELAEARWQAKIDTAGAAIGLLSSLINRNNPALAKQVQAVGGGALKIASILHASSKIGTAAMTLNIASVGLEVLSAFADSGPSADEVILEQLHALAQAIEAIHRRLDVIDAKLDQLLRVTVEGLQKIDRNLVAVRADLRDAAVALEDLSWQLGHTGKTLASMMQAGFTRDLLSTQDRCLSQLERTGLALDFAAFSACESDLWLAATAYAGDEISLSPAYDADMPDALLDQQLSGGEALRFLLTFLNARFDAALPTSGLKNPVAWTIAADSYATLIEENRWHAQRLGRERRATLLREGENLESVVRALNVDADGQPNHALFHDLLGFMQLKQDVAMAELSAAHEAAQAQLSHAPLRFYDLSGGTGQLPPAELEQEVTRMSACWSGTTIDLPAAAQITTLPATVRNWLVLTQQPVSVCFDMDLLDANHADGSGQAAVTVVAHAGGRRVMAQRFIASDRVSFISDDCWDADCWVASLRRVVDWCWGPQRCSVTPEPERFDWLYGEDVLTPAEREERDAIAQLAVAEALRNARGTVTTALAEKAVGLGPLHDAVAALHGSAALLRTVVTLADEEALENDALLELFERQPKLSPGAIALRLLAAAEAADLTTNEQLRLGGDVAAWIESAATTLPPYREDRAAALTNGHPASLMLARTRARLALLEDGPFPEAVAELPFAHVQSTKTDVIDLRWTANPLPARFDVTGAWTLSVSPSGGRICLEPQRPGERLVVLDNGEWRVATTDEGPSWLCASLEKLPEKVALAIPTNSPPQLTCHDLAVTLIGDSVQVDGAQLASAHDADDDSVAIDAPDTTYTAAGAYDVVVRATDALGATTSCTAVVTVTATPPGPAAAQREESEPKITRHRSGGCNSGGDVSTLMAGLLALAAIVLRQRGTSAQRTVRGAYSPGRVLALQ